MNLIADHSIPLATLPAYPSIPESLAFQLNGLIVVFIALGAIWGLMELSGVIFRSQHRRQKAESVRPTVVQERTDEVSPEILAVIAAVVATVISQPHRIHRVSTESPLRDWAREGRREIFDSHKVR